MKVSFTGISNPAFIQIYDKYENHVVYAFSSLLNDDIQSEDYTDFVSSLTKNGRPETYINSVNPKLVSVVINKIEDENTGINNYLFRLNGKELPINTDNMPIFDFLAKLTRNIAGTPEKKLVKNEDYKYSDEIRYGLIPKVDLAYFLTGSPENVTQFEDIADNIRNLENAKNGAEIINNSIYKAMVDYFA